MHEEPVFQVLLLRGRAGAGKTITGSEISAQHSATMAEHLHATAAGHVHRVATDDRTVAGIATEIIKLANRAIPLRHPRRGPPQEY